MFEAASVEYKKVYCIKNNIYKIYILNLHIYNIHYIIKNIFAILTHFKKYFIYDYLYVLFINLISMVSNLSVIKN